MLTVQEKKKKSEYDRKYYQANKFKWISLPTALRKKQTTKEWLARNPDYRETHSSGMYRNKELEKLAGRPKPKHCEICKRNDSKICFDHDHKTNKFRGWICMHCNSTLGYAKDDIDTLYKLIDYLNLNRSSNSPPL